jgi:cytochrome c oxidase subunit 1
VITGLKCDRREVLVTSVMDAEPIHKDHFPEPSIWPFLAAVAVGAAMLGTVFTPWAVVWGAAPIFVTLTGWFWPKRPAKEHVTEMMAPQSPDPVMPEARA